MSIELHPFWCPVRMHATELISRLGSCLAGTLLGKAAFDLLCDTAAGLTIANPQAKRNLWKVALATGSDLVIVERHAAPDWFRNRAHSLHTHIAPQLAFAMSPRE